MVQDHDVHVFRNARQNHDMAHAAMGMSSFERASVLSLQTNGGELGPNKLANLFKRRLLYSTTDNPFGHNSHYSIATIYSPLGHIRLAIQTSLHLDLALIQIIGVQVQTIDNARTFPDYGSTKLVVVHVAIVLARHDNQPLVEAIHAVGDLQSHCYKHASLNGGIETIDIAIQCR